MHAAIICAINSFHGVTMKPVLNNAARLIVFVLWPLFLFGCASTHISDRAAVDAIPRNVDAVQMPDQFYKLSDQYADHRKQQRWVGTSAGRIAYSDHGEGDVLVLLHGVPTSSWMYRKMIAGLQSDMRVISIDFLGYGSSDKPKNVDGVYSPQAQASYVQAVLEKAGVQQYSLLFHDMGGLPAWELLRASIDASAAGVSPAIKNFIALNTIIAREGFKSPDMEKGMMVRQMMRMYSNKLTSSAMLTKTFDEMGLRNNMTLSESECRGYVLPMQEGSDRALYSFFTGFDDELFAGLEENVRSLQGYNGGALIIWGDQDEVLTSAQIPLLRRHLDIPDRHVVILPQQAHFLAEEIPQKLVQMTTSFLAGDL